MNGLDVEQLDTVNEMLETWKRVQIVRSIQHEPPDPDPVAEETKSAAFQDSEGPDDDGYSISPHQL